jgi:ECF transporter S component (folate family)
MRNNVKKLVFSALLVALSVILTRFFYFPIMIIPGVPIFPYFGYFVIMFSGFLLGPTYGAAVGGLADVLGYFINPQGGGFNPVFTLTSIAIGFIPGLFYKKAKKSYIFFILAIILTVLVESISTTLWVTLFHYVNIDFRIIFIPRLITDIIVWIPESFLVFSLLKIAKRIGISF